MLTLSAGNNGTEGFVMLTIGQKKHQGFTLLELLVVLAIVATVSALVSARFGFNTDASEIGKLHKQLNAVIAKAQYLANLDRRPVRISVDAEKRSLLLEDKLVFTWSDSVTLTLAGASALTPSREFITFYLLVEIPEGNSDYMKQPIPLSRGN